MEFGVETITIEGYDRFHGKFLKLRCLCGELTATDVTPLTIAPTDTERLPTGDIPKINTVPAADDCD